MKPDALGIAGAVVGPDINVVGAANGLRIADHRQGTVITGKQLAGDKFAELERAIAQVRREAHGILHAPCTASRANRHPARARTRLPSSPRSHRGSTFGGKPPRSSHARRSV